jgi:hypothetical protein
MTSIKTKYHDNQKKLACCVPKRIKVYMVSTKKVITTTSLVVIIIGDGV